MPNWTVFTTVSLVLLGIILVLTRNTAKGFTDEESLSVDDLSTRVLLANVVVTQGGFAVLFVLLILWTGVPWESLKITAPEGWGRPIVVGTVLGGGLYIANAAIAANLPSLGIEYNEDLRSSLAPNTPTGWVILLCLVLPLIAGFEELLFRGVLIGAYATGYGISPWALVLPSAVVFALCHGLQGHGGILVTGVLGVVLGVIFVLSGSLLIVIVAHYVINALEFLISEAVGIEIETRLQVSLRSG